MHRGAPEVWTARHQYKAFAVAQPGPFLNSRPAARHVDAYGTRQCLGRTSTPSLTSTVYVYVCTCVYVLVYVCVHACVIPHHAQPVVSDSCVQAREARSAGLPSVAA